jgi:hypothetical protein
MFTESLTPGPELENRIGHERHFSPVRRMSAYPFDSGGILMRRIAQITATGLPRIAVA